MKKRKPKTKPIKEFKGCLKMPLYTGTTIDDMIAKSVWYGDWKTKSASILSKKRRYYVNIYITLLDGRDSLTTFTSNPIHESQMKTFLAYIINEIDTTNIDWDKSYLTISC